MSQSSFLKQFICVLILFNIITMCFYYNAAQQSRTLFVPMPMDIENEEEFGRHYLRETYGSREAIDQQMTETDSVEIVTRKELSDSSSLIIGQQEKEILTLTEELEKTKKTISQLDEAKKIIEANAAEFKHNVSLISSKTEGQSQTIDYITQTMSKINPYRKLGLYEKMPERYYNFKKNGKFIENVQYYAVKHNPGYCDTVDLYNLRNPDNVFKHMNFITDYGSDETLIRQNVMKVIGKDVMPGIDMDEQNHQEPRYDMAVNGTMMFFKKAVLHSIYEINKEWACLSQMYNHIPGNGVINRKDLVVETVNKYVQKYGDKPQCIKKDKFFPSAYRLEIQSECQEFFNLINTPKYYQNKKEDPVQYLLKLEGAHRAMGVFLLDEHMERQIRDLYGNGSYCGKIKRSFILQKYISNPLFLDKQNKFDFRMYMLIASVNPLIVYYHDGFLRVSLSKYDKHSKEKNVHFTNTHLSKEIFSKAEKELYDGMTEEELREYQMWTMEDLQNYLLKSGKITDPNWLDNHLRPKFKEAFAHIARMAEDSFYKSSSVFEMFGLDFVIDENMDIWFIECNPSPQMVGTTERKTNFLVQMATDLFEIQYAYLRSRMKRVQSFINEMEEKASKGEQLDYAKLRKDFDLININKLDTEFPISKTNGFTLITDKNIEGPGAYFGNLSPQCFNA